MRDEARMVTLGADLCSSLQVKCLQFQHLSPSMQNNGFLCLLHGIHFIFVLQGMDCGTTAPYMGGGLSVKGFVNALS